MLRSAGASAARGVIRDSRGVAAVEFALIAPVAIVLFFGLAQVSQAIVARRHVNHSASSLGDLVSQCANVNDSDLSGLFAAGGDMMAPLPRDATLLGQRVTSVQVVDAEGTTQAQWSQAADQPGLTTAYAAGADVALPPNIVSNTGDDVIMAESVYLYSFPASGGGVIPLGPSDVSLSFGQSLRFDVRTYFRPRKSQTVVYTGTGWGGTGAASGTEGRSCYS